MKNLYNILLSLILFSCSTGKPDKELPVMYHSENSIMLNSEQVKIAGIVSSGVSARTIKSILKLSGKIDVPPQNMVSVCVPMGGYLKSTHLLPGMKVKKGEVIASIEDQQYVQLQQDYLSAKAKLNYTERDFRRQKELNTEKAGSDKVFQQAESDYITQKVTLRSLSEKLRLINIDLATLNEENLSGRINVYAPIDGFVSRINANIGKYVNPADVVFELVNPSDIHLALTVFEKDIDKLFIGQKLKAFTNNKPDIKHNAEVLLIGRNLSSERSIEVHCHFDNYDNTLIPGMFMNAELEVAERRTAVVPELALVRYDGKDYVFVEREKQLFVLTEVKTGITEEGFIELLDAGNYKQNKIVVKGAYALLMALKNKQEE